MHKIVVRLLVLTSLCSAGILQPSQARTAAPAWLSERLIGRERAGDAVVPAPGQRQAQLLYPPVTDQRLLRVVGKGRASQPADTAYLELNISEPSPSDGISPAVSHQDTPAGTMPVALTETDVAPIVMALKRIGIPEADIKVQSNRGSSGGGFPFPFPSPFKTVKTLVGVRLPQPSRERIEQVIDVTRDTAIDSGKLALKEAKVRYAVDDCLALEQQAYQVAVADAKNRADAIAQAAAASLHPVPSIAEPFYNVFIPDCSVTGTFPFRQRTSLYDPSEPIAVEVYRTIFVTYTFKR